MFDLLYSHHMSVTLGLTHAVSPSVKENTALFNENSDLRLGAGKISSATSNKGANMCK